MYLDFRKSFLKIPNLNFKILAGVSLMRWREGKDISRHISRVWGEAGAEKTGKSQNITGLYIKLRSLDFILG